MRNFIIGLCLLMIAIPAAAGNYPGKDYVCKNCTSRDNFVDYMWAGLTRMQFTNGFYVRVFSENHKQVVRVAIKVEGGKYYIERSGTVIGKFIKYGPVDLATLQFLRADAVKNYRVVTKPKPGGGCETPFPRKGVF